MLEVGTKIRILYMEGEPHYTGREGTVTHIDDYAQVFGTWGDLPIYPGIDEFVIIEE